MKKILALGVLVISNGLHSVPQECLAVALGTANIWAQCYSDDSGVELRVTNQDGSQNYSVPYSPDLACLKFSWDKQKIALLMSSQTAPQTLFMVNRTTETSSTYALTKRSGDAKFEFFALSKDSCTLLGGLWTESLEWYDLKNNCTIEKLRTTGHTQALAVSPEGDLLAHGRFNSKTPLSLWDMRSGKYCWDMPGENMESVADVAFSPDQRYVAVLKEKGIEVWDRISTSKKPVHSFFPLRGIHEAIAFTKDGGGIKHFSDKNGVTEFSLTAE